jgi:tRNA-dihydrouridine synthase
VCAQALEQAGAAAVTVHGRTADQYYRGHSDRNIITAVKRAVSIPVIASGDLFSAADAVQTLQDTGADAVALARGVMGNPWLFREAAAALQGVPLPLPPTPQERLATLHDHAEALVSWYEDARLTRFRAHAAAYVSGLPGATEFRRRLQHLGSLEELDQLIAEYECYHA